jgi:hypothetical protein
MSAPGSIQPLIPKITSTTYGNIAVNQTSFPDTLRFLTVIIFEIICQLKIKHNIYFNAFEHNEINQQPGSKKRKEQWKAE